jgi:hypothetical protein
VRIFFADFANDSGDFCFPSGNEGFNPALATHKIIFLAIFCVCPGSDRYGPFQADDSNVLPYFFSDNLIAHPWIQDVNIFNGLPSSSF